MGLFDLLFKVKKSKVLPKEEDLDYADQEAIKDSVTKGWEYNTNFMLRTPKICLENYGKRINTLEKPELIGEPQQYGADGSPMGYQSWWSRITGIEEDFDKFADTSNNPLYAFPSDIGRINPKTKLKKIF